MILDSPTRSLQIVLGEAKTTNDCDIVVCYATASTSGSFIPGLAHGASNGTTPVTALAAPLAGSQILVSEVRVYNNDTVVHQIVLRLHDGSTNRTILSLSVQAGGHFVYTPGSGGAYLQRFWRST